MDDYEYKKKVSKISYDENKMSNSQAKHLYRAMNCKLNNNFFYLFLNLLRLISRNDIYKIIATTVTNKTTISI